MNHHATSLDSQRQEHRTSTRAPLHLVVQLQHSGGPQLGLTRDLSLGGLSAEVEEPPPRGLPVNVALQLGELGRLDLLSRVTRVDDVVAVQFDPLSGDDLVALRMFLSRQQPSV